MGRVAGINGNAYVEFAPGKIALFQILMIDFYFFRNPFLEKFRKQNFVFQTSSKHIQINLHNPDFRFCIHQKQINALNKHIVAEY